MVDFIDGDMASGVLFIEMEPVGGLLEALRWRLNRRWDRLWGR